MSNSNARDEYHSDVTDQQKSGFFDAATAATQRPTDGNDRQPAEESYTYPTPRPGGQLGF